MAEPELDFDTALQAITTRRRGPGRTSPAYDWLARNYDRLAAEFRKTQPSWVALADVLTEHGIMGADGQPTNAAALRSTWLRLDAAMTRKRGRQNPAPTHPRNRRNAPLPPHPSLSVETETSVDEDDPIPDFDKTVKDRP